MVSAVHGGKFSQKVSFADSCNGSRRILINENKVCLLLSWQTLFLSLVLCLFKFCCCSLLAFLLPSPFVSYFPPSSSDGPVIRQCDRDVGWPHGQHHSAWKEKAVIPRSSFPPTIWQQVRNVCHSFYVQIGLSCGEGWKAVCLLASLTKGKWGESEKTFLTKYDNSLGDFSQWNYLSLAGLMKITDEQLTSVTFAPYGCQLCDSSTKQE